jgi:uncharacterized alkaline shock family protein YloU
VEGQSFVSPDVVARYARDVAQGVPGVVKVVDGVRKGVRIDGATVELHLALEWGVSIRRVAVEVQQQVADYLVRMTDTRPVAVNVVVEEAGGLA